MYRGDFLKTLLITILFVSTAYPAELCDDKSLRASNSHKHYIYPLAKESFQNLRSGKELEELEQDKNMQVELRLINFEHFKGGSRVKKDIELARTRLERVLNSTNFKTEVYNHRYAKKYQFKKNKSLNNQEVYQTIIDGADKYDRSIDNKIDMILCPYYSSKNVIGYTYSNRKEVWLNFKYYRDRYNDFQISDIVGNILHEWIHNAGFTHSFKRNNTRKYTIPYAVGYISRDIARALD